MYDSFCDLLCELVTGKLKYPSKFFQLAYPFFGSDAFNPGTCSHCTQKNVH